MAVTVSAGDGRYGYNDNGQLDRIVDGEGTITRYIRDCLNRVREVWVGTDDTPTSDEWPEQTAGTDLVQTGAYTYGYDSTNDLGEYLEIITSHVDSSTTRTLTYTYDWRGRRIGAFGESASGEKDYAEGWTYDNLNRVTQNGRYSAYSGTSPDFTWSSNDLVVERLYDFDARGRLWKETLHRPSSILLGSVSGHTYSTPAEDHIYTYSWFNDDNQSQQIWTEDQSQNVIETDFDTGGRDRSYQVSTENVFNELIGRDTDDNGTDDYTLTYDEVGNLTDDGEDYEYVYDPFGRLRKINDTSDQTLVAEYKYNGLGYRISVHQDTDTDGDVDANDMWYHFAYDDTWRIVANFREDDVNPKEQFVYHNAGLDGMGSSSYIDSVILRNKDASTGWTSQADALDEVRYYCQNWRADVSAIVTSGGYMVEWAKYSPYGIPFGLPGADTDSDGDCDATDITQIQTWIDASSYDVRGDVDLDGDVDSTDKSIAQSNYQGTTSGWNDLTAIGNRKGYAGYERDGVVSMYYVRNRVLHPVLGRWTRRDPLGYVDGKNLYEYVATQPTDYNDPTGTQRFIVMFDGFHTHPTEWGVEDDPDGRASTHWMGWIDDEMRLTRAHRSALDQNVIYSGSRGGGWNQHTIWFALNDIERRVLDNPLNCATGQPDPLGGCYHAIYVMGWSNGGGAAIRLANVLHDRGVCAFGGGVTFDPVPRGLGVIGSFLVGANLSVPVGYGWWVNSWQRLGPVRKVEDCVSAGR